MRIRGEDPGRPAATFAPSACCQGASGGEQPDPEVERQPEVHPDLWALSPLWPGGDALEASAPEYGLCPGLAEAAAETAMAAAEQRSGDEDGNLGW